MIKKYFMLVIALIGCNSVTISKSIWNREHLEIVRQQLDRPAYAKAYQNIIHSADSLLNASPLSVMMKKKTAASGDKHDYLSQARYYWPDPMKPNGLPYIRRDGESNPELKELDRERLGQFASRVTTLSLAYYLSNEEKYAKRAVELIHVWFFEKATRMNPNLKFAQMVPGENKGLGRCQGVIDTYSFIEMLDAIHLLHGSKSYTTKDDKALKDWFSKLLDWILTNPTSQQEYKATNNHGIAYDTQVISFADFVGNTKIRDQFLKNFGPLRICNQIKDDGSQPRELQRTLAFGYSQFNLTHMIDVMQIAHHTNVIVNTEFKILLQRIEKALDFLTPYLGKNVSLWPYKQISAWEEKQQDLCKDLYRLYLLDPSRKDYLRLYNQYAKKDLRDRFTLLYLNADITDDGYASAENQLLFALKCVDEAKAKSTNKALVIPRCLEKDGSLRLVNPRDWCSGFFGGELWQIYQYNGNDSWKKMATNFTLPIEGKKNCTTTHDLGFVIYNSFGQAYKATGDTCYKNVVIQAAKSLLTRYNGKVHAIRSWDHHNEVWKFPVIIDNMVNLELLFAASELSGDQHYRNIAINHANTTMKNHFRSDGSSYHVVDYNPETGKVEKKQTHQGFSNESVWSRGQAWGLYGFTMCYRYTHERAYLDIARKIAKFFFSQQNLPKDYIPYWDMRDPAIPNAPRDASAASIFASGLYELAHYVDVVDSMQYVEIANHITKSLYYHYRCKENSNQGFLLMHSTGNYPAHDEIDVPISYADYYYLEALARAKYIN